MTRIAAYKQERAARLQEQRDLREYAELVDCTFTPTITRERPPQQGPVVVRGLERHMELQVGPGGPARQGLMICSLQHSIHCRPQARDFSPEQCSRETASAAWRRQYLVESECLPRQEQPLETGAGQLGPAVMADPACPLCVSRVTPQRFSPWCLGVLDSSCPCSLSAIQGIPGGCSPVHLIPAAGACQPCCRSLPKARKLRSASGRQRCSFSILRGQLLLIPSPNHLNFTTPRIRQAGQHIC